MVEVLNSIADGWAAYQWAMFWQVGVLVAILWLIDAAIHKCLWPQVRYALWMLVLVKLVIPPTLSSPASVTQHLPEAAEKVVSVRLNETPAPDNEVPASGGTGVSPVTNLPTFKPNNDTQSGLDIEPQSSSQRSDTVGRHGQSPLGRDVSEQGSPSLQQTDNSPAAKGKSGAAERGCLSWKVYAMFVWLAGVIVLATWLAVRLRGLRKQHIPSNCHAGLDPASRQYRPGPRLDGRGDSAQFEALLKAAAARLNLKRLPEVIVTDRVACPAVFGVLRPVLLMPAKFGGMGVSPVDYRDAGVAPVNHGQDGRAALTARDMEHILLHELAHIKRGDLVVHAVYMCLQIAYWFNPLLWMIRRKMQNLRELCCDATVARLLKDDTVHYRQTLLETARGLVAQPVDPGLGLLGLFENSNWLATRLQWLEKKTWKNRPLRIATVMVLVSVMAVCVLPMANRKAQADFFIDTTQGYIRCNATVDELSRMLIDMAHTYGFHQAYAKGTTSEAGGPEYLTVQYTIPDNKKLTIEAVSEAKQPLNIRFTLENGADYTREEIMIELSRRLGMLPKALPLKLVLPGDVREAVLLPEYLESKTVLSLKTGKFVPEQQAEEAQEPYLYYNYTFPPGANPRHFTVDTIPENCIGVEAQKMDLAGGGWGKDYDAAQGMWLAENASQLPAFHPLRLKLMAGDQMLDGTFISRLSNPDWPYITAFRGDDGTHGVFEITKVQDRKIHVRFRTIDSVTSDQSPVTSEEEKSEVGRQKTEGKAEAASASDPIIQNAEQKIENSSFTAALPNGVTVEMIGLGTAPWKPQQQWWKPDGTKMNPPALKFPHLFEWKDQPNGAQFTCAALCKLSSPSDIDVSVPSAAFSNGVILGANLCGDGMQMTYLTWPPFLGTVPEKTDVRLAVGTDKFAQAKRLGKYTPGQHQQYSLGSDSFSVILHPLRTGALETPCVDLTCNQKNKDTEFRVFAKLKNGETEQWHGGGIGGDVLFFQSTPQGLNSKKLEDVEDIVIEYRTYEWVTFKNVALRAGVKTNVEVKADSSQALNLKADVVVGPLSGRIDKLTFKSGMSRLQALETLGKMCRVNIIPSDAVGSHSRSPLPVSEFYDVTFEEALQAVCGTDLVYEIKGNFVHVYTKDEYQALPKDVTVDLAREAVAVFYAERFKNVSKFTPLEWGQLTVRDDGTWAIRCRHELSYYDKDQVAIHDSMFFIDQSGKVSDLLHVQPPAYRAIDDGASQTSLKSADTIRPVEFEVTLDNGVTVELLGICEHPSEGKQWWRPDGSLLPESPYDDDYGRAFPRENQKGYKFAVKFSNMAGKDIDARIIPREFKTTNGGGLLSTSEKDGQENTVYSDGRPDEKIVWLGTALDEMFSRCDIRVGVCWGGWKNEYEYEKDGPNDAVEWVNFENVLLRPVPPLDTPVSSQSDIFPSNFKLQFNDYRGTYNLVVSVQNNGDVIIPNHRIRFYRGEPQQGLDETGHPHSGWHEAGPIEPGKTWNEATYGFHLQDGEYEFSVVLDYDQVIAETNETNNQKTIHVKVEDGTVAEQSSPLATLSNDAQLDVEPKDQPSASTGMPNNETSLAPPGRGALMFDGVDDFLRVQASNTLRLENPFTVQMWIKPEFPETASPDKTRNLLVKGGYVTDAPDTNGNRQAHGYGFAVTLTPSEDNRVLIERVTANGGTYGWPLSMNYTPGDWMHLALKFDAKKDHYEPAPQSDLIIGSEYLIPTGHSYKGQIGELRIWNRILTKDEIAHYEKTAVTGNEPHLAACWTFEQNGGQIAFDCSPNKNDARFGSTLNQDKTDPVWTPVNQTEKIVNTEKPGKERSKKVLQFPDAKTENTLFVVDPGDEWKWWWPLRDPQGTVWPAQGRIVVESNAATGLMIFAGEKDSADPLPVLDGLDVNDLHTLIVHGYSRGGAEPAVIDENIRCCVRLSGLKCLILNNVGITDGAITEIGQMQGLERLCIVSDDLEDEHVAQIAQLKNLRGLRVCGNLGNASAESIAAMGNLQELLIEGMYLSNDSLYAISQMKSLRELALSKELHTEDGLQYLAAMPSLQTLDLMDFELSPADAEYIAKIPNLKSLSINREISDEAVEKLSCMGSLTDLTLNVRYPQRGGLTDAALHSLAKLKNLTSLDIGYGQFTDDGFRQLAQLPRLKHVMIPNCTISEDVYQYLVTTLPELKEAYFRNFPDLRDPRYKIPLPLHLLPTLERTE